MKISQKRLKEIINEELEEVITEVDFKKWGRGALTKFARLGTTAKRAQDVSGLKPMELQVRKLINDIEAGINKEGLGVNTMVITLLRRAVAMIQKLTSDVATGLVGADEPLSGREKTPVYPLGEPEPPAVPPVKGA